MKTAKFPLYLNDGICVEKNSQLRMYNIKAFKAAVNNKELNYVDNKCLCGNNHPEDDVIISEKDRYGFAIPQILCSKCGLVRSKIVLDEPSNRLFYEKYYRGIYLASSSDNSSAKQIGALFADQYNRGKRIFSLIKKEIKLKKLHVVSEIGCGAGGILMPFKEYGLNVNGYDYDKSYLDYGCSKGLDLHLGDFYELAEDCSCDLVLINHVLEHFLDPLSEMSKLLRKVKIGGYVYIEVPGIMNIEKVYIRPILYFQNAHVYNYYKDYLWVMFEKFGLNVIYGDDVCRFIVQKTRPEVPDVINVFDSSLAHYPQIIADYLINTKKNEKKNYFKRIVKSKLRGILPEHVVNMIKSLLK